MTFDLMPQPPLPFPAAELYAAQALAASTGPWPGVTAHRDITFGPEPWQRFDVFAPEAAAGPLDVIVFLHGGGWTNGYKEWCGLMAPGVVAQQAILVAPTYRLAPDHRMPVILADVATALREIHARIAQFGGNPARIFLAGHSAGGHLAAEIALRPTLCIAHGFDHGALKACLPVSGILDLRGDSPTPGSLEARVYEMVLDAPADDWEASPLAWIDQIALPMHFTWGKRDSARVRASNDKARQLLQSRPEVASFAEDDTDHFGTHLALIDPAHRWYGVLKQLRESCA